MLLRCVECHGEHASGGRWCAAFPCGHVFHQECSDFSRKKEKVLRWLDPGSHLSSDSDHGTCPKCSSSITVYYPLFIEAAEGATDAHLPGVRRHQERVFHLQRKLLMRMSEFAKAKQITQSATMSCASLHEIKSSLLRSLTAINAKLDTYRAVVKSEPSLFVADAQGHEPTDGRIEAMTPAQLMSYLQALNAEATHESTVVQRLQRDVAARRGRLSEVKKIWEEVRTSAATVAANRRDEGGELLAAQRRRALVDAGKKPMAKSVDATLEPFGDTSPSLRSVTAQTMATPTDSTRVPEIVDVDALDDGDGEDRHHHVVHVIDDSESDDEESGFSSIPRDLLPSMPAPNALPTFGLGTGRSLFDISNASKAMRFQTTLASYPSTPTVCN